MNTSCAELITSVQKDGWSYATDPAHLGACKWQFPPTLLPIYTRINKGTAALSSEGIEGLLEGYRSGRPAELPEEQKQQVGNILGQRSRGLRFGQRGLDPAMIAWVIEEEFGIKYHPGHVRKLLHAWGFSVQRPRRAPARADAAAQDRWHRRTPERNQSSQNPKPSQNQVGLQILAQSPFSTKVTFRKISFARNEGRVHTLRASGCSDEMSLTRCLPGAWIFQCSHPQRPRAVSFADQECGCDFSRKSNA